MLRAMTKGACGHLLHVVRNAEVAQSMPREADGELALADERP